MMAISVENTEGFFSLKKLVSVCNAKRQISKCQTRGYEEMSDNVDCSGNHKHPVSSFYCSTEAHETIFGAVIVCYLQVQCWKK